MYCTVCGNEVEDDVMCAEQDCPMDPVLLPEDEDPSPLDFSDHLIYPPEDWDNDGH